MPVNAQQTLVTTRIATIPSGALFTVDGTIYSQPAVMTWPKGSKHVVSIDQVQVTPDGRTMYKFASWADSSNLLGPTTSNVQVITADPAVASLVATVAPSYRVDLNFFGSTTVPILESSGNAPCGAPSGTQTPSPTLPNAAGSVNGFGAGLLSINGACFSSNANVFFPAGTALVLNAFPYDGFVFLGWSGSINGSDAYLRSFVLNGPITLVARFSPARKVTIYTNPAKLQVYVDRTLVNTFDPNVNTPMNLQTGIFQWAEDSQHVMSAPSPQLDPNGRKWVFDSWDFGGGQNAIYTVTGPVPTPTTLTAKFVPGGTISLLTNPVGLKLTIDGRDNWPGPGYNFDWALGAKHTITAPASNTDAAGRVFVFKGWSNGGGATQSVSLDSQDGLRLTANYEILNRLTMTGSSPGLKVQVDGVDCLLPCTLDRASSAQVRITAPASISMGTGARMDFVGWSDGGPTDRTISFSLDSQKLAISYRTMFQAQVSADPPAGAQIKVSPSSADGYYTPDTQLTIAVTANPGYKFKRWDGDLVTVSTTVSLDMGSPRVLKALLDKTPYIAPAGVRNAAGETPDPAVAPGSIIAIVGANLADQYVAGPTNPLSQTVGDVTVRLGGTLLPLVFVSPGQINAQLPSDLPDGPYQVYVKLGLQQEIPASLSVTRNAPGLFNKTQDDKPLAVALHEDGTPITVDSPAKRGETITLFGTGFGPYDKSYPDGFPIPSSMQMVVADPVEVHAGDLTLLPAWAGPMPGMVGMTGTKLKITDDIPVAQQLEVTVRVQGKDSNKVVLPVE